MSELRLIADNLHEVAVGERRVLFHVPTTALFELDAVGGEVLDLLREREAVAEDDVRRRFDGRIPPDQVVETLREFIELEIIDDGSRPRAAPKPIRIREYPLSTLVLNVNTGCNLSCSYCYKEDLATPAAGDRMGFETAARSVDLLLAEAAQRERINISFFGGEPLSNMALIHQVVDYAEERCAEEAKSVDFSLTTNATLLTEELVEYFDAHRFGLTVSMDGPKPLHDRNRKTVGGKGTYDVVAAKARMLLSRYRSRPVGARVTLTSGVTDVIAIHRHLKDELGFFEVGFSPVTAGDMAGFNLDGAELAEVFRGLKVLGHLYLEAALEDRNIGFSNMHQLMTDLSVGHSKALPCGAGLGLLAVDNEGDLHLCHRFTGSENPTYGNVASGIDKENLGRFLESALDHSDTVCATCRIRKLCAGGCYHESYARYSDPLHPTIHYCDLMRDWIDFGVQVYVRLRADNPGFITRHVEPRRAKT
jgi:uncharacterized protein